MNKCYTLNKYTCENFARILKNQAVWYIAQVANGIAWTPFHDSVLGKVRWVEKWSLIAVSPLAGIFTWFLIRGSHHNSTCVNFV